MKTRTEMKRPRLWRDLMIDGLTTRVGRNLSFYAQAGYQFAIGNIDGGRRQGIKGDIGLRYAW